MSTNEIIMSVFFVLAIALLIAAVIAFVFYLVADTRVKKAEFEVAQAKASAPAEMPIYLNQELVGKCKVENNELHLVDVKENLFAAPAVAETVVEKEEATEETHEEENGKVLVARERILFDDAFEKLNKTKKGFINELIEYALAKEKSRLVPAKFQRSVMFRQGKLIVLSISRGEVIGKFYVASADFKEFRKQSDTSIKEKPVKVKVVDETALAFAKRLIDISYENLKEMGSRKEKKDKVAV